MHRPGTFRPPCFPANGILPQGSSFLTGQKGSEKPAPTSEARGTAQGDCGPLENPLGVRGGRPRPASFLVGGNARRNPSVPPPEQSHPGGWIGRRPAFAGRHLLAGRAAGRPGGGRRRNHPPPFIYRLFGDGIQGRGKGDASFIHRLFGDGKQRRGKGDASFIHRLFGDGRQRNGFAQRSVRCRRCALRRRLAL